jgi:hypothetical protein
MKIAYLIITHRNPRLLGRFIDHLSGEESSFFIHLDAKANISEFAGIEGPNVHFTRRVPVYWGEFSQVTASLILIEAALACTPSPDYLMLLTGSEFPLRSREYIHRFLERQQGREFITMAKTPSPGKPLERVNTIRFPRKRPILRFVFRALAKLGLASRDYRKYFDGLEPYSGVGWWALTNEACRYVLDFAKRDQAIAKFYQHTHASDEAYIHTILGNSPYRAKAQRCFLLEDWSGCVHHPRPIDEEHLRYFESQPEVIVSDGDGTTEVLFARKYSDERFDLVEKTVAMIARKERLTVDAVLS